MFDINSLGLYGQMLYGFLDGAGKRYFTNRQKKEIRQVYENNMTFQLMISHYLGIAMAMNKIRRKGGGDLSEFPGINPRTVSLSLIMNGCVIFRNKVFQGGKEIPGLYAQPGYGIGIYNMNLDPLKGFVTNLNGTQGQQIDLYVPGEVAEALYYGPDGKQTRDPSGFIVWDNDQRFPVMLDVIYYASKIAECYATLDTTVFWLNIPAIFMAPKELVSSIDETIQSIARHEKFTIQSKGLGDVITSTEFINTNANGQNLKDVTGVIQWYDSQFLQRRGIDSNSQMDKKGENLVEAEVTVNNEITRINRQSPIDCKNRYLAWGAGLPGYEGLDLEFYDDGQEAQALDSEQVKEESEEISNDDAND